MLRYLTVKILKVHHRIWAYSAVIISYCIPENNLDFISAFNKAYVLLLKNPGSVWK